MNSKAIFITAASLVCLAIAAVTYETGSGGEVVSDKISVQAFEHSLHGATSAPGTAQVCLTDADIHLPGGEAITLPATSVFQLERPALNAGETPVAPPAGNEDAAFVTLLPISLSAGDRCKEVSVKMLTLLSHDARSARASETKIYALTDVIVYLVPAHRPAVEIGKLIDDISVKAVLKTNVTASVRAPNQAFSDAEKAAACLQGAEDLAHHLGKPIGRQLEQSIYFGDVENGEASFGCGLSPRFMADFFASWEGQAQPPSSLLALTSEAGATLTKVPSHEVMREAEACIAEALKPEVDEMASRQFGAKLDCQAFDRDGGGGSITVYRRFWTAR